MRMLLKRWWFWLGAVMLSCALSAGLVLTNSGNSRINQKKFDLILDAMTKEDVDRILGSLGEGKYFWSSGLSIHTRFAWLDGPNFISASFTDNKLSEKELQLATPYEYFRWQCSQFLEKIGLSGID
jgi:hypothetical protein